MTGETDDAVARGILTPAANLRINKEDEEEYNQGFFSRRLRKF